MRPTIRHTVLMLAWLSVLVVHLRSGELAERIARRLDRRDAWRRSL
jgi:hypothetical protein